MGISFLQPVAYPKRPVRHEDLFSRPAGGQYLRKALGELPIGSALGHVLRGAQRGTRRGLEEAPALDFLPARVGKEQRAVDQGLPHARRGVHTRTGLVQRGRRQSLGRGLGAAVNLAGTHLDAEQLTHQRRYVGKGVLGAEQDQLGWQIGTGARTEQRLAEGIGFGNGYVPETSLDDVFFVCWPAPALGSAPAPSVPGRSRAGQTWLRAYKKPALGPGPAIIYTGRQRVPGRLLWSS